MIRQENISNPVAPARAIEETVIDDSSGGLLSKMREDVQSEGFSLSICVSIGLRSAKAFLTIPGQQSTLAEAKT